ncbi:MAG: class I SAM-dependent methyltransferase [Elusimicrobiales bacterium]|nr:class I SAM-dependent methyltransferase [Elusimicrobiales bacterium]
MKKTKHTIPDGTQVYWSGLHYDRDNHLTQPGDEKHYLALAKAARGPVLELACGTGRLAIPLKKAGVDITGLDVALPMIEQARAKAKEAGLRMDFIHGDARKFRLKKKFRLIFIAYNSMQHIHSIEDLESFFASVKAHLAPGGRFAFDVFNPDPRHLSRDSEELIPIGCYEDPEGGGEILVNEQYFYDRHLQSTAVVWHYSKKGKKIYSRRLRMRCFFPLELDALLRYNGFKVLAKYGDFKHRPFGPASPKQILVTKPAGSSKGR